STHKVALAKRGLSILIAIILLTGTQNSAVAQTTTGASADTPSITLSTDGSAVVPDAPPTIQETLTSVCAARGYGEDCAKILLGMAWKESRFKADAKGDYLANGFARARGWFQIHYKLHGITIAQAEDLTFSANWTLDYMESNGYPKNVRWAVQCHNGCGKTEFRYADSAIRNGKLLWDKDTTQIAEK
ncbi:MAG: hypothetical protein RLZZ324_12, partial [Candidatus Parcubacteria bacterium]